MGSEMCIRDRARCHWFEQPPVERLSGIWPSQHVGPSLGAVACPGPVDMQPLRRCAQKDALGRECLGRECLTPQARKLSIERMTLSTLAPSMPRSPAKGAGPKPAEALLHAGRGTGLMSAPCSRTQQICRPTLSVLPHLASVWQNCATQVFKQVIDGVRAKESAQGVRKRCV